MELFQEKIFEFSDDSLNQNFHENPKKKLKIQIGEEREMNLGEINQLDNEMYRPENENSLYSEKEESSEYKIKKKLSNLLILVIISCFLF